MKTCPIDKNCHCSTCKNYSLAYLHHLLKAEELIVLNYITTHNIYFMNSLMKYIRESIKKIKYSKLKKLVFRLVFLLGVNIFDNSFNRTSPS